MVTTVLKNVLSSVLFPKPQARAKKITQISVIDFVMELAMFNSKINDWLDSNPPCCLDDLTVSLQHDLNLSKTECEDVLRRLQNKYDITFGDHIKELQMRGYRIPHILQLARKVAWQMQL